MDRVAAERFPEAIDLARFRIIPSEAAARVIPFTEAAEVDPAIRAERRIVHDGDTRGTKLSDAARVARRAAIARWWLRGRSTFAERPRLRGVVDEQLTSGITAGIKFAAGKDRGVRGVAGAWTAVGGLVGFGIEDESARVIVARPVDSAIRQDGQRIDAMRVAVHSVEAD